MGRAVTACISNGQRLPSKLLSNLCCAYPTAGLLSLRSSSRLPHVSASTFSPLPGFERSKHQPWWRTSAPKTPGTPCRRPAFPALWLAGHAPDAVSSDARWREGTRTSTGRGPRLLPLSRRWTCCWALGGCGLVISRLPETSLLVDLEAQTTFTYGDEGVRDLVQARFSLIMFLYTELLLEDAERLRLHGHR